MNNEHEEENSMRKKNNSKTVKQAVKPVEVKKEETVAQRFQSLRLMQKPM